MHRQRPAISRSVRGGERRIATTHPSNTGRNSTLPKGQGVKMSTQSKKRLYVLDTNVYMHDPSCLFRFEEHDIFMPTMVLEELDNHKKGTAEINRNVREVSRTLDAMISASGVNIAEGVSLRSISGGIASGRLYVQTEAVLQTQGVDTPDNRILAVVAHLVQAKKTREVVLVSKDINMRIKGKIAGVCVEDYHNDMVIEDTDLLYSGTEELPSNFWNKHSQIDSWKGKDNHLLHYRVSGQFVKNLLPNQFVYTTDEKPFHARVMEKDGSVAVLQAVHDYTKENNAILGIMARSMEQNFALNLLMDPNVDIVTLIGKAGSGKTILALASAILQTVDKGLYTEIIFTRITVPIGEEIGFLPGGEEEKMMPWMGALEDNLDVLMENMPATKQKKGTVSNFSAMKDLDQRARKEEIRSRIKVKSLNFMRGRTFLNKILIIDEVQNLTAKQMKTLITRAGPGTKVICLGNLAQIDTPYLTEGSSGLTYLIDRFKGWPHGGHVILMRGERSRLATHAEEVL